MADIFDFTAKAVLEYFHSGLELKAGFIIPPALPGAPFTEAVYRRVTAVIFVDL
jgi:hypothetical protein